MWQRIKEYIFLDESGKPEVYSRKGVNLVTKKLASKYLVIAVVRTTDQLSIQREVTEIRLKILKNKKISSKFSTAYSLDSFHAQNDYPEVKQLFYEWIKNCKLDLKIADYIVYAVFQVFENSKRQYYDIIKSRIGYIQDIFNKKSYSRSNPL